MTVRETLFEDHEGLIVLRSQECDKILQAVKEAKDYEVRTVNTQRSQRYLGSVPNVVAVSWAQEWGVKLFSAEWSEKASRRLKHDPDWKYLKVGG